MAWNITTWIVTRKRNDRIVRVPYDSIAEARVGAQFTQRGAIQRDDTLVAGTDTDAYYRTEFPQAICGMLPTLRSPSWSTAWI